MENTKIQSFTLTIDQISNLINTAVAKASKTNNNKINNDKQEEDNKGTIEKLKSGNYRFRYQYKKTRYSDVFTKEEIKNDLEAKIKLKEWVKSIEEGIYYKKNLTVSEWSQIWIDEQIRPNSSGDRTPNKYINFLNNRFLPKFGNRDIRSITMQEITSYFNWLKTQKTMYKNRENNNYLSVGTLIKFHSIVHTMFETAVAWKKIESNPCPPKKRFNFYVNQDGSPREIKEENTINAKNESNINYYSKEEYDKALNLLNINQKEIRFNKKLTDKQKHFYYGRLIAIELDFKTGLRRSELYALTKKDFDFENRTVTVSKTRQLTKTKGTEKLITKNLTSVRKISLPESIIPKLKYFFDITPSFFEYIFEDLSIDGLSDFWKKWQQKNNLKIISLRDIRHTHASILFLLGVDIKIISQRLGHKSIATTEKVYLFIIVELRQKLANQIDNL